MMVETFAQWRQDQAKIIHESGEWDEARWAHLMDDDNVHEIYCDLCTGGDVSLCGKDISDGEEVTDGNEESELVCPQCLILEATHPCFQEE